MNACLRIVPYHLGFARTYVLLHRGWKQGKGVCGKVLLLPNHEGVEAALDGLQVDGSIGQAQLALLLSSRGMFILPFRKTLRGGRDPFYRGR